MATAGAFWVYKGSLSLFTYLMFVVVSKEFYKPFASMEAHWMNYIKVKDSYSRIARLLNTPVVKEPAQPKTVEKVLILLLMLWNSTMKRKALR